MRIAVFGTGYLGATHAACMAELGHEVMGVDVDPDHIASLQRGSAPFHEPGLDELLARHTASGRLRFTTSYAEAAAFADVHFIGVGTPQGAASGAADLSQVHAVVDALAPLLRDGAVILGKSTVPVGTTAELITRVGALTERDVVLGWNPEFLREGKAVADTLHPDRIVVGATSRDRDVVEEAARAVYAAPLAEGSPFLVTDLATAELVKVSANSFLATKISFINAVAEVCDAAGADVTTLAQAIGLDERIGEQFLQAGIGYGGACLPKDVRAYRARATELGAERMADLLADVDKINNDQRTLVTTTVLQACEGLANPRVAVLGLTFKEGTDDVRDSPALDVVGRLVRAGVAVRAWDPQGMVKAERLRPDAEYATSAIEACKAADVIVVMTPWPQIRQLDPTLVADTAQGRLVVDARNCLDATAWNAAGWDYRGIGRR